MGFRHTYVTLTSSFFVLSVASQFVSYCNFKFPLSSLSSSHFVTTYKQGLPAHTLFSSLSERKTKHHTTSSETV
ncbi:Uncharacterized protein APZ42_027130 [Daphnia magna]|uniref:Uncharacterized protein n=1 Tax=Daphnia magna TaxID=35525 RepID=A0A164RAQ6_9CRUS|nr:Uncharacterized protein APZ42_027130 [Daphnia magna]